ncbi:13238_t:CDS:1, partial [Dentiscutata heterogama]
ENNNIKSQMKSNRKAKLTQAPIDKTKNNISPDILKNTNIKLLLIKITLIQNEKPTNKNSIIIEIEDFKS